MTLTNIVIKMKRPPTSTPSLRSELRGLLKRELKSRFHSGTTEGTERARIKMPMAT
jgi:hypothetical protein